MFGPAEDLGGRRVWRQRALSLVAAALTAVALLRPERAAPAADAVPEWRWEPDWTPPKLPPPGADAADRALLFDGISRPRLTTPAGDALRVLHRAALSGERYAASPDAQLNASACGTDALRRLGAALGRLRAAGCSSPGGTLSTCLHDAAPLEAAGARDAAHDAVQDAVQLGWEAVKKCRLGYAAGLLFSCAGLPFRSVGNVADCLAATSLAWSLLNAEPALASRLSPARPASPFPLVLADVVREHQAAFASFTEATSPALLAAYSRIPVVFPFPFPCSDRGRARDIARLETIEPNLRNHWHREFGERINFKAYRPLPSTSRAALRAALDLPPGARRILVDVGTNGWYSSPKQLLDMYEHLARFDAAILVEPKGTPVPSAYAAAYNVTVVVRRITVGDGGPDDLFLLLPQWVKREDYVVLKFDADDPRKGPTIEWPAARGLLAPPLADLWDELYVEMHFFYPQLGSPSWKYPGHSMWEAYDLLRGARACGMAVHAWP